MNAPTFQEAVDYAAARSVVLPDLYYGLMVGVQRAQAVSIAGLASLAQIKSIIDAVHEVMEAGGTFGDFQAKVKSGDLDTTMSKARLDNIFRTNIQGAYSRGRYEQQSRVAFARPYWMYSAINDSRTRPNHLVMDNTILHHSHHWWRVHYPPNGYRCRCTVISLTEAQARARGGATPTPLDVTPDDGWDYSVGEAYSGPIDSALDGYAASDPLVVKAVEDFKRKVKELRDVAKDNIKDAPKKQEGE